MRVRGIAPLIVTWQATSLLLAYTHISVLRTLQINLCAGKGNRNLVYSLEKSRPAIERHPLVDHKRIGLLISLCKREVLPLALMAQCIPGEIRTLIYTVSKTVANPFDYRDICTGRKSCTFTLLLLR